ncbi:MAG: type II toxin-antitoxin system Phd/YefM family antitoxin [Chloroflexi bacterium]|nr:type II toxin-antitoxin system Phd/YefM family antitoxin [Chloroflexota bacterium]MYA49543.1 type II toxin-antitoxin system Phd/YefM family antitoxin [Chloroflexota bacterium]MYB83174.1 type II toxin-antitoxin system Phd/YefM family antitoxin [Chloroflexota bacterium]MYK35157.1 type II toxin-antitoxin system Phd/YefM family antitoxin [Chloroflexota bacterium]
MTASDETTLGGIRTIKASEFKAKCLKLMDEVAESGQEIVVTKNGRPVSRVVPYREKSTLTFGRNRGLFETHADIVEPMPAEWFEKDGGDEDDLF